MAKTGMQTSMIDKREAELECGQKECKNMLDYTIGDKVSIVGEGKIVRMVDENGDMRMKMIISNCKLGDMKAKKEVKKESAKEVYKGGDLVKAMKSMLK